jgi:hypothetical protein
MTRTVASAFPQDPQRKLRALAFSEVREIMKLEFGDYDAGPTTVNMSKRSEFRLGWTSDFLPPH